MNATVSLRRCPDYAAVEALLPELLAPLGGMEAFVRPGQRVLLKPNLLMEAEPPRAANTHPDVVRAVIHAVRAAGGQPTVGDSPANVEELDRVWTLSGLRAVCEAEGVPQVNFERRGSRAFAFDGRSFRVAQAVLDADVVINLPKVKTHVFTRFTCGVKNLYGTIPGFQKTTLHKLHPDAASFGAVLADLLGVVKPSLTIADGVVAMQGDGPSAGTPHPLGLLAASADPVAMDVVLASLLGLDPAEIDYLRIAGARGLGEHRLASIPLAGDLPDALRPEAFLLPGTLSLHRLPRGVVSLVQPFIWNRPRIGPRCIRCGRCIRACPVEALTGQPGRRPRFHPRRCIACCCCHEICPVKAIAMRASPLLRAAHVVRHLLRRVTARD